ncbi:hypothetical protein [Alteromonas sp. C1M14]|uniref:DUF6708 domain-containing protein n=1 Tax=Alteromonas sp. C1M14 TaxID=2841567 RepID=UPI001C091A62|nr:hypothetical protein [Alteromonas sp. C1M14]MBU2978410.1 hypothetical protein [Alteromonas sp. C1M14]
MTKTQQKILEAVGVLSRNRLRFSSFSKKHTLDINKHVDEIKVPGFVCAKDKGCLVLAESWFRERGIYISWGTLGGTVLSGFFLYLTLVMPWLSDAPINIGGVVALCFTACIGFLLVYPLLFAAKNELKLQGLQYTVFNSISKNVHFVSDVDFQPKTCRWDECTFCLAYSAGGVEGFYYELKGYLFNEDGSVKDSFSFDDYHYMATNSNSSRQWMINDLSARFEYVRRFMEEGADSVEPVTELLDLTPSLSETAHRFQPKSKASDGKKFHLIYSIVRTIFLIPFSVQVVGHYIFCRYCHLPQWPQGVIDECGEEVFPKR